ncbi:MAG: adenylate kinase [Candidatus Lokiarchaeota archaeon]|nr:adenylate kinase [Candidatus Lokiarchaeota archaeon]
MQENKHIILLGPPGAGKGTFSSQVKEVLPDIIHVSTGDIFRENLKNKTPLGLKAKSYMDEGKLVPDEITNDMVKKTLDDISDKSWVLDGYPRNLNQAEFLSKITTIDSVILLSVDHKILIKRILGRYSCPNCGAIYNKFFMKPKKEGICDKCGERIEFKQRADDTEETLNNRLDVYEKNTKPLIDYYKDQGLVKEIDYTNKLSEDKVKEVIF